MLENETFEDVYLSFWKDTSPPTIWSRWSSIFIVSSLLNKKVFFDGGEERPFPATLYMLFIGRAGLGKGRVTSLIENLIREQDATLLGSTSTSFSKMIKSMTKKLKHVEINGENRPYTPLTIISEELESVTQADDELFSGLIEFWNKSTYRHETHTHGDMEVIEPAVTFLGNTNPTSFATFVRMGRLAQGLSRRCILIHAKEPAIVRGLSRGRGGLEQKKRQAIRNRLSVQCTMIAGAKGEFQPTDDWLELIEENYQENYRRSKAGEFHNEHINNHYLNRMDFLIRLSMIASIMRQVGPIETYEEAIEMAEQAKAASGKSSSLFDYTLKTQDFHTADRWLQEVEESMPELYLLASTNDQAQLRILLAGFVKNSKRKLSKAALMEFLQLSVNYRTAKEILDSMLDTIIGFENGKAKLLVDID